MSSTALGMGAWGSYDSSAVSRARSRSVSLFGGPPRIGSTFFPPIQQTVVVDGALNGVHGIPAADETTRQTRRRETIFGPDVGDDDQPGWVPPNEGNKVSVDVVKKWVDKAKSEEGLHATTTLQALVNLKRPTLLLQPLDAQQEADITSQAHTSPLHLLKFNYDAMTPQVQVTLTLHPAPSASTEDVAQPEPQVLYTGTHPGGFNQTFTLPAAAAIDLSSAIAPLPAPVAEEKGQEADTKEDANVRTQSEDTTRSSIDRSGPAASPDLAVIPELSSGSLEEPRRRGLGGFFNRRREHDVEAQIEMSATNPAPPTEGTQEEKPEEKPEPEHGMRLLIRLEGVGAEGPLRRRNAQLTHILVSGTWAPDASISETAGKRVWVVKVVRREAQIGAHSFLLKEIYGLSSSSNNSTDTSYPPASNDPYASTPNECIVCLTSPRDVVLLPCRHLVVCRECAVGMVEFGAGGRVARRDDEEAATTNPTADTANATAAAAVGAPIPPPAPAPTRRKKKAKGWYCPVCRQPYTSLLRLALAPSKQVGTPSRAPSLRSVRTTRSLAPTLPDGAEAMLADLVPNYPDDDDCHASDDESHTHNHDHNHTQEPAAERPTFVIAEENVNPPPAATAATAPTAASAFAAERKAEGTV